jgi:ribosomal protein L30E
MVSTEQLRKLIEEKKITIGTQATTKALHTEGLKRILVANNASQTTMQALTRAKGMTGIEVETLNVPNDQLGTMCKKPFSISVLGIKK